MNVMPVTECDVAILELLARYYVLTREQIQRILFPGHRSGRSARKRLVKLQHAGLVRKHRIPVVLPGTNGAAPVYYLTAKACEVLASWLDDERFLAANTGHPRGDRLSHWVALNETRMVIEAAIAAQRAVELVAWINEWETVNKDADPKQQFVLHTQLSENPPLSCSPDAAFLLAVGGHAKVYYLERDLGTSSPRQVAVLCVTTSAYRRRQMGKELTKRPGAGLWLFIDEHDLTPASFLHGAITYDAAGRAGALVRQETSSEQEPT